jgi:hypothetical protein
LVFGFLVGCSGRGGSGGDNILEGDDPTTPSGGKGVHLTSIEGYFPDFPDNGHYIRGYRTIKAYSATVAQIANFNTTVVQAQSYEDLGYGEYYKYNAKPPYIDAYVGFFTNQIELQLESRSDAVTIDDSTYDSIFGSSIGGKLIGVVVQIGYTDDITSEEFDTYVASLTEDGFNCSKDIEGSGEWDCSKKVDNLIYEWHNFSNGYSYFVH